VIRQRYEFMLQNKATGEVSFRNCLVADVQNLINRLRYFGYAVIGVEKI